MENNTDTNIVYRVSQFSDFFDKLRGEIEHTIIGMKDVVTLTMVAIYSGGHILLEGAPGLGKTSLVKSIAKALGLSFRRVQFTADLMPADITGTQVLAEDLEGKRTFEFKEGPLFANVILADEINRAGPKTQSALLEAMEEEQVTVFGQTFKLPSPYFVLATQNPIELEGTYPLPEAQLDRFMFKLLVNSPSKVELAEILARTTGVEEEDDREDNNTGNFSHLLTESRKLARLVAISDPLMETLVGLVYSLVPTSDSATDMVKTYVRYGPGPRGAQSVLLSAKVFALIDGRMNVSFEDIGQSLIPALRHRLVLNYRAEAEGITPDSIIADLFGNK